MYKLNAYCIRFGHLNAPDISTDKSFRRDKGPTKECMTVDRPVYAMQWHAEVRYVTNQ
jgi:hypothetical protein